jgi:hypothetical protein
VHRRCFQAAELVGWLVATGDFAGRDEATSFLCALAARGAVVPVGHPERQFRDAALLFRFEHRDGGGDGGAGGVGAVEKRGRNRDSLTGGGVGVARGASGNRRVRLTSTSSAGCDSTVTDWTDFADSGCPRPGGGGEGRDGSSDATTSDSTDVSSSADFAKAISSDNAAELARLLDSVPVAAAPLTTGGSRTRGGSRAAAPARRLAALLHRAVNVGAVRVATELMGRGVAVNARTLSKDTPLHRAAARGDTAMVTALLEHGADAEAADANGQTPLLRVREDHGGACCCCFFLVLLILQ